MDNKHNLNTLRERECILFSTADWDAPYWTNKQHTARLLSQKGWRVLYVESVGLRTPNLASGRDLKRLAHRFLRGVGSLLLGPRQVEKKLWILSPLAIPKAHDQSLIRSFNQGVLRWVISRFMKKEHISQPLIWTYHPFILEAIKDLRHGPLIYHCVDDLSTIPGVDGSAVQREERKLLSRCSIVFTTSEPLKNRCKIINSNTFFFPNVVDLEHFGKAQDQETIPEILKKIPEPRLVYHGLLSDYKVDFQLLLDVARNHPEWQLIFIGEEREGQSNPLVQELKSLPNVHFLGYLNYESLPDYLRGMSVGLLPTQINDYTRFMFPMKYFEYLAAGLPVVSTPLEFTRSCDAGLISADGSMEFIAAIKKQLQRGRLTREESVSFVGPHTWKARMDQMIQIIESVIKSE